MSSAKYPENLLVDCSLDISPAYLKKLLKGLPDREYSILRLRYQHYLSYQTIGNLYGFSRERAYQYVKIGIRHVRESYAEKKEEQS